MKIPFAEWFEFRKNWYAGTQSQRLGQAFCNRYNITNPMLFYMTDHMTAATYIEDEYVDYYDQSSAPDQLTLH